MLDKKLEAEGFGGGRGSLNATVVGGAVDLLNGSVLESGEVCAELCGLVQAVVGQDRVCGDAGWRGRQGLVENPIGAVSVLESS